MELNIYNESVVINSVVNGLIAIATVWAFWTPFLILAVVPLINAMFDDAVCGFAMDTNVRRLFDDFFYQIAYNLYTQNLITLEEYYQLVPLIQVFEASFTTNSAAADKLIASDKEEIKSINFNMFLIMGMVCIIVIVLSIWLAVFLIYKYNLNGHHILAFNIVMALVIVTIEVIFFVTVGARYIPFDPNQIQNLLAAKIADYLGP